MSKELFSQVCSECSALITNRYSTSFTKGIKAFHPRFRRPIYNIYGFVRFADEIVDTFHDSDKKRLLHEFRSATTDALDRKISLNPVLHAFQETVHIYNIERDLIDAFLNSMEKDLYHDEHTRESYQEYIYGSAEVIGLMCLRVFVEGDQQMYDDQKLYARKLGSAFQKLNFLRDMKSDFEERGRSYFPKVEVEDFSLDQKQQIEAEIEEEFEMALIGIKMLPKGARFGVYLAYIYYVKLFRKIRKTPIEQLLSSRIRIPNSHKFVLLVSSVLKNQLNQV